MDTRLIGVDFHEPQLRLVGYEHVCSLHGICLRLIGRVAFALQRHWRHVVRRWQPPSPRHATSWRRWVLLGLAVLSEMGTAVFSRHDMVFVKGDVSWTNVSHDKRHTTTEPEPYPT